LDEPFNGLDLETNKIIEVIISNLNKRGKIVLISSHILDPLLNICHLIHEIKSNTIHKTYQKQEFNLIEENLFGEYKNMINQQLAENF
jgi:ABC-2 type transport system ATP-binding protein